MKKAKKQKEYTKLRVYTESRNRLKLRAAKAKKPMIVLIDDLSRP